MIVWTWRLALAGCLLVALAIVGWLGRRSRRAPGEPVLTAAAVAAFAGLAVFAWVVARQVAFPLQLECMELTVLQHARRFVAGLPVYPAPAADFVPLAYNPGLYVFLAPLFKVFSPSLALLRLPSVAATLALIVIFGAVLRRATGSWRWAVLGAFVPVLAYRSLDCYLTKGHGDAPMILCALAGALLLPKREEPAGGSRAILAALLLAAGFWFKQHGALPAIGAGLLLLLRGLPAAWPPLIVLALLGPIAYLLVGPGWFGPEFVLSTYQVPAAWSHWSWDGVLRLLGYLANWWAVPTAVAAGAWLDALRGGRLRENPVLFLWPAALASGLMGALDSGSSDNVFALAGVWSLYIALGALGPHLSARPAYDRERLALAALAVTGAMLVNDAREWVPSRGADAAYRDLRGVLEQLDGPVYVPWLGDLPFGAGSRVRTTARAHWVALEDRIRGGEAIDPRHPFVTGILRPVAQAPAPAYLLTIGPLEQDRILSWLAASYELQESFGTRFDDLRELPTRFGRRTPRYLYRKVEPLLLAAPAGAAAGAVADAVGAAGAADTTATTPGAARATPPGAGLATGRPAATPEQP